MSEKNLRACVNLEKEIVKSNLSEKNKDELMVFVSAMSGILTGKDKKTAWKIIRRADRLQEQLNKKAKKTGG